MRKYKVHTLKEYLDVLSAKSPVPGGGSAAALTAALGAALLSMVAHYSVGKARTKGVTRKIKTVLKKSESFRKRLLDYVDADSRAYLKVVRTRRSCARIHAKALREASAVPKEVCRLCFEAIQLTPFLVKEGNKNLMSDVEAAAEFLLAAFKAAAANIAANQVNRKSG